MFILFISCSVGLKNSLVPLDTADIAEADTGSSIDTGDTENDTDEPIETGDTEDTIDTGDTQDTEDPVDPANQDYDGDGFSPNEGDCDDNNPNIFPFTFDDCDGIDNDCDGLTDEDGAQDAYEPNNDQLNYYDVGSYTSGDLVFLEGVISAPDDYDHFEFYLDDGWIDSFSIVTDLHAISITTDFVVELWLIDNAEGDGPELLYTENVQGAGLGEYGSFEGSGVSWDYPLGYDDSGNYQAVVYAISGAGCEAEYQLDLELSY